jgi:hypothetical protein
MALEDVTRIGRDVNDLLHGEPHEDVISALAIVVASVLVDSCYEEERHDAVARFTAALQTFVTDPSVSSVRH